MNNSRIAKNTLALYIRMFLSMGVSLFTSRIVLQNLGVDNYGIYTIVGGFVALFAFFNGPLNAAASRFFAFEIGKGKSENLKIVFGSILYIHLLYAVITVVLLEAVGLYLLTNKLVIPHERMFAAVWVFHFSVVGILITIIQTPLVALIIATERMKIYAYLGIVDVVVKLAVAVAINVYSKGDKLILYACLLLAANILVFLIYHIYCNRNIRHAYNLKPQINLTLQKTMLGYTGWTLVGQASYMLRTQGTNVIFNLFFGVVMNAAIGITNQVNGVLNSFRDSLTIAMNPQIIKRYASGDNDGMNSLITQGAKISFFLFFLIVLPVLLHTEYLLSIWLVEVPHYTSIFTQLLVISSLINSLSGTMEIAVTATGKIMSYQLVVRGILLFNVPVSYLFLKFGYPPTTVFYISIIFYSASLFLAIAIVKMKIPRFSARYFVSSVLGKSILVAILSFVPPFILKKYVTETLVSFCIVSTVCVISSSLSILFVGLNKYERNWVYSKIKVLLKQTFVIPQ